MKVSRKKLNLIIENYLNEAEKTIPVSQIKTPDLAYLETDPGASFADQKAFLDDERPGLNDELDKIIAQRDVARGNRGLRTLAFGPSIENNPSPDDSDISNVYLDSMSEPTPNQARHGQEYYNQYYDLGKDDNMPSVDDTITQSYSKDEIDFEDEDTEESPLGTQYSLEKTEIDDIDDSSSYEDDTDESQDVITYEDKDGNERTFVGGKEVTPGDEEVDTSSFIEKLRNYFRKK